MNLRSGIPETRQPIQDYLWHPEEREPTSYKNDQKSFSHAVIPDGFYRESILRFYNYNVQSIIGDAGFRPGRRPTFVLAKVGKTIDAQSGHIGGVGRRIEERANSLRSNKARQLI